MTKRQKEIYRGEQTISLRAYFIRGRTTAQWVRDGEGTKAIAESIWRDYLMPAWLDGSLDHRIARRRADDPDNAGVPPTSDELAASGSSRDAAATWIRQRVTAGMPGTSDKTKQIRDEYANTPLSYAALGAKYGVTSQRVYQICNKSPKVTKRVIDAESPMSELSDDQQSSQDATGSTIGE